MRSRDFRDEFFNLVRNDEINIQLFSLHLFLMANRLKRTSQPFSVKHMREYLDYKKAVFMLNTRIFPKRFKYDMYEYFHSHLPEQLFYEDFQKFIAKANTQTFKQFSKAFSLIE